MARKPAYSYWPLWCIAALLGAWWIIPAAWRAFARDTFATFQAPAWAAHASLADLQAYWGMRAHTKNGLIESGRDLARLRALDETRLQENAALRAEIGRLETLLKMPPRDGFRYEPARVMRRDLDTWQQQFLIRKGTADGVKPGMGVVFSGGVAGRVREVAEHTAVVDLVSSRRFRIVANFENDRRPFAFQGQHAALLEPPSGEIRDIPPDVPFSTGAQRRIVTSGLGGTFPDGLTLGYADTLERGDDGLFLRGNVKLSNALLDLQEVSVLVPLNP